MDQTYQESVVYQGLRVERRPASIGRRTMAYMIDLGIVNTVLYFQMGLLMILFVIILGGSAALSAVVRGETVGTGILIAMGVLVILMLLSFLAVYHGYFIYFEYKRGGTLGKRLMGLQVVNVDGSPLRAGQCVLRDFLRYVDCLLIVPGLICMLLNRQNRRLGDLAAGTLVIYSERRDRAEEFLYITQDEYQYFQEMLQPTEVTKNVCEDYLTFAYKKFIKQSGDVDAAVEAKWEETARSCYSALNGTAIDRQTVLLFFAEHCHQSINAQH